MASRNLNFPKSYGSGIVMLPVSALLSATPGVTELTPGDRYSMTVAAGSISQWVFRTVDAFRECLFAGFQMINQIDRDVRCISQTQLPDGRWEFVIETVDVSGLGPVPTQVDGVVQLFCIFRDSTSKF